MASTSHFATELFQYTIAPGSRYYTAHVTDRRHLLEYWNGSGLFTNFDHRKVNIQSVLIIKFIYFKTPNHASTTINTSPRKALTPRIFKALFSLLFPIRVAPLAARAVASMLSIFGSTLSFSLLENRFLRDSQTILSSWLAVSVVVAVVR